MSRPRIVGLSEREREVLDGIYRGLSNKAIGLELGICEDTVKCHAKKMMRKLGTRNRAETVAHAYQHGILGTSAQHTITTAAGILRTAANAYVENSPTWTYLTGLSHHLDRVGQFLPAFTTPDGPETIGETA